MMNEVVGREYEEEANKIYTHIENGKRLIETLKRNLFKFYWKPSLVNFCNAHVT